MSHKQVDTTLSGIAEANHLESVSVFWNVEFDVGNYIVPGSTLAVFLTLIVIAGGRLVCWCVRGKVSYTTRL
jgi:hypothetical protein